MLLYVEIFVNGLFSNVQLEVKNVTLLIIEGPDQPKAKNVRRCINEALAH